MAITGRFIKYLERESASLCHHQKIFLVSVICLVYSLAVLMSLFSETAPVINYSAPVVALSVLTAAAFFGSPGFILLLPALLISLNAVALPGLLSGEAAFNPSLAVIFCSLFLSFISAWLKSKEKVEQKNLHWLSIIDGLTETYNHRYFQQRLTEEVARTERGGGKLGLAFIDVDNFKRFNDLNGHVIGDIALKKTASFLNRGTRLHDIVCRYGGDEFVIILPGTDSGEAAALARRLIEGFASLKMPGKQGQEQALLTLSIGISAYPVPGSSRQELVKQADKALYEAKKAGKNTAVIYSDLQETGEAAPAEKTMIPGIGRVAIGGAADQPAVNHSLEHVLLACRAGAEGKPSRKILSKSFTGGIDGSYDARKMGEAIGLGHLNMDKGHITTYLRELNLN